MNMKLKSTLLGAILAMFAASAMSVYAAEDKPAETVMDQSSPKMEKAEAKKKVKRHSHTQEKTGIPEQDPQTPQGEPKKPLHDHRAFHK
jgi:hypothetical protein